MKMLQKNQIPTPRMKLANNLNQVQEITNAIGTDLVIKAQVLAGGRGKGVFSNGFKGGVQACHKDEAVDIASKMLSQRLITKQTGEKGKPCNSVLICERLYIKKEFYCAVMLSREGYVLVGSDQGGMDIETVARENPKAIHKLVTLDLSLNQAKEFAKQIGFKEQSHQAGEVIYKLYKLFTESDSTLIEINPLVVTNESKVVCMDCKMNFDDNAEFRQKRIFDKRDLSQEDSREIEASKANLNYIELDGTIGCLVNGAGLAMATMDIIKLHGGSPSNFLDVGGGATSSQVTKAFQIIQSDPKVNAILVNIFGGIMRCDVIAQGILEAASTLNLSIPLVVRLQGTKVDEAKKLMIESGMRVIIVDDLDEAAEKVVKMSHIVEMAKSTNIKVNFELPI